MLFYQQSNHLPSQCCRNVFLKFLFHLKEIFRKTCKTVLPQLKRISIHHDSQNGKKTASLQTHIESSKMHWFLTFLYQTNHKNIYYLIPATNSANSPWNLRNCPWKTMSWNSLFSRRIVSIGRNKWHHSWGFPRFFHVHAHTHDHASVCKNTLLLGRFGKKYANVDVHMASFWVFSLQQQRKIIRLLVWSLWNKRPSVLWFFNAQKGPVIEKEKTQKVLKVGHVCAWRGSGESYVPAKRSTW